MAKERVNLKNSALTDQPVPIKLILITPGTSVYCEEDVSMTRLSLTDTSKD